MLENVNYVHFDELEITHTESLIIQADDFCLLGMNMSNSWQRVDNVANKLLYNQGSEKENETGWYYTPFRRYDATIGRFNGVDVLADQMASITPYLFFVRVNSRATENSPYVHYRTFLSQANTS